MAFSAVATFVLLKVVDAVVPLRVGRKDEGVGLDVTQHGEEAYTDGEGAVLLLSEAVRPAPAGSPLRQPLRVAEGGAA